MLNRREPVTVEVVEEVWETCAKALMQIAQNVHYLTRLNQGDTMASNYWNSF